MKDNLNDVCPLCKSSTSIFKEYKKKVFYRCTNCFAIFLGRSAIPDQNKEKERYLQHNNDVNDPRYQKFVEPIVTAVLEDFTVEDHGLDFGAGTGPVISKLLKDHNYQIEQYDPFFHYNPDLLQRKYNYIVCCEVIEHFHYPKKEFELLKSLLLPEGILYCMTEIYNKDLEFDKWYYKNDPTHVFLYHDKTLEWIKEALGFSKLTIDGRLVKFFV